MREQKRVYLSPETHAALMAYCRQHGLVAQAFVDTAIKEALARRVIARHWNGEQWVDYMVAYPLDPLESEAETNG